MLIPSFLKRKSKHLPQSLCEQPFLRSHSGKCVKSAHSGRSVQTPATALRDSSQAWDLPRMHVQRLIPTTFELWVPFHNVRHLNISPRNVSLSLQRVSTGEMNIIPMASLRGGPSGLIQHSSHYYPNERAVDAETNPDCWDSQMKEDTPPHHHQ